ncbi:uncharacterized protein LOC114358651 [Ostrinia furnacalis]|uniref:uncharacterized protein LOC114358651 n=1 Tax=Ostrinia furnacalis TaxID=93504 RepID=UPI00103C42F1|nr:uncharacterized protein LOC114358651 [Ostrinia furnacalis]
MENPKQESTTAMTKEALHVKEELIKSLFAKYEEYNLKIITALDRDDDDDEDVDVVETKCFMVLETIMSLKNSASSRQGPNVVPIKLPDIKIPPFTEKRALALENSERPAAPNSDLHKGPTKICGAAYKEEPPAALVANKSATAPSCMLCVVVE